MIKHLYLANATGYQLTTNGVIYTVVFDKLSGRVFSTMIEA